MAQLECPVCRGTVHILRPFARRGTETAHLHRCTCCRCEFLHPQPSDQWLANSYSSYFARRHTDHVARPKTQFFRELLRSAKLDLSGKSVLEVGSGEGDSVLAINELWPDAKITVVETSPDSEVYYEGLECAFVNASIEQWLVSSKTGCFDAVLLFDLLEHLRDPAETLRALVTDKLVRGGTLVATFPNRDALLRRVMGRIWFQYKVEHLFYFSARAVERMAQRAGLETKQLRSLTKRLPLDYLLNVGIHFSPNPVKHSGRVIRVLAPAPLLRFSIPLRLSEWLWVAQRA